MNMPLILMNKVSILGCGWLGEPLAYCLQNNGIHVKGSSRNRAKLKRLSNNGIESHFINCDKDLRLTSFFESDVLIVCFTNKDISLVQHLISLVEFSTIRKVIFVSSTSVYIPENKIVTEDSPLSDSSLVEIETLFYSSKVFTTTIVRFAGLVGPERHPGRFFSKGNILNYAESPVNLIHLDDCIQLVHKIIQKSKWGQIYNGCSTTHPKKGLFYAGAAKHGGYKLPILGNTKSIKTKEISNSKMLTDLSIELIHPDLLDYYS